MKIIRNIARRPWPRIGGWLPVMMLICGVLASCSSEDESTAPLPDGKYPLQLTAEVAQPQTRAGGKDAWTGGEEIRVSLEGVFGNKTYVMDASGNASPKDADNAFYWKNTDEARVSAWTPDIESETDISDQSGGYAAFDVLYASAIGRYDQAINLRFIHRMAKIEVILKAGEGITEEELEGATVTIFGDPLTHSTAGLVSPGDQSDGEIKPYYDAATKKYEALVPPQDMTGKPLIRISIGSNDFTYTPETEAAGKFGFFGGKRYAYTITVKASGIEVTAAKGGTWNAGGSENVGVTITYDGTETEPKIGDYYYSDGTWSDGGLRKLYADGTMEWAETKPQPENGKNVIAIVCGISAGTGAGDNTLALIMTRGLAEISRLVHARGGQAMTCMGLAGMGDLIATCTSEHSRNRTFGYEFAHGVSLDEYQTRTHMVVEGAVAARSVSELARSLGVDIPLTFAVEQTLYNGVTLDRALEILTDRVPSQEF